YRAAYNGVWDVIMASLQRAPARLADGLVALLRRLPSGRFAPDRRKTPRRPWRQTLPPLGSPLPGVQPPDIRHSSALHMKHSTYFGRLTPITNCRRFAHLHA